MLSASGFRHSTGVHDNADALFTLSAIHINSNGSRKSVVTAKLILLLLKIHVRTIKNRQRRSIVATPQPLRSQNHKFSLVLIVVH